MKCPVCRNDRITFLGIWYTQSGEWYVLKTHYGCNVCKVLIARPVSEDSFHYVKPDGSVVMRPTIDVANYERRLRLIEIDPGFYVRKE